MPAETERLIREALCHITADDTIHAGDVWKVRTALREALRGSPVATLDLAGCAVHDITDILQALEIAPADVRLLLERAEYAYNDNRKDPTDGQVHAHD